MRFFISVIDLLFLLLPRFVTETVAIRIYQDDSYEVLCLEEDLMDDDQYSALADYKAFTFLGQDYFCTLKSNPEQ